MKKLILASLCAIALLGCDPEEVEVNEVGRQVFRSNESQFMYRSYGELKIVELEGHDYVLFMYDRGCGITHSGGCKCHNKMRE